MNNNTNPNLPANAIRTTAVKEGMLLILDNAVVKEVSGTSWFGHKGRIFFTDGSVRWVNGAGTMRLA
jgi:hypothetical protein